MQASQMSASSLLSPSRSRLPDAGSGSSPPGKVKTRLLILSDTHGHAPRPRADDGGYDDNYGTDAGDTDASVSLLDYGAGQSLAYREPLPDADVVLHCGDLTLLSSAEEYAQTVATLAAHPAALKLLIAGNHDVALGDEPKEQEEEEGEDDDDEGKHVTAEAAARQTFHQMVRDAHASGLRYLPEGVYAFALPNGARLTVYASPWTPEYGRWAFQYAPGEHAFDVPPRVDVAMTHGPPHGVLDLASNGTHAGCPALLEAMRRARPALHCFGHIHEAWGAYRGRWTPGPADGPPFDESRSQSILSCDQVRPPRADDTGPAAGRTRRLLARMSRRRCAYYDLTCGGEGRKRTMEEEQEDNRDETLFVNAAIMNVQYQPRQYPWLVDINLPQG